MTAYTTSGAMTGSVSLAHGRQVSYQGVLQLAEDGDPAARRVVEEAAYALGRVTAAVTSLTGVGRIILSGEGIGLVEVAPDAMGAGRRAFSAGRSSDLEPVIRPMDFHEWARGAAVVAVQEMFPQRLRAGH